MVTPELAAVIVPLACSREDVANPPQHAATARNMNKIFARFLMVS